MTSSNTTITASDLDAVSASTVYDPADAKIGKVKQVYLDNVSGEPRWLAVSTGLFSSDSLVPIAGARRRGSDEIVIAASKDTVKGAPHLDNDGQLSAQDEEALYAYYGLPAANTTSTGLNNAAQASAGEVSAPRHAAGTDTTSAGTDGVVRHEERLNVGTEREAVGTARLRKYVVTEEQTITVPTTHEEVRVVREPIVDSTSVADSAIGEQDQEVTLHRDRVVVNKETVPVEKVGLDVREVGDEQTVSDTVRKERIDTDGVDTGPSTDTSSTH